MRVKTVRQHYLSFELPSSPLKVAQAYRERYVTINRVLLDAPEVLDLAHRDFERWLSASKGGRESKYTSDEILRVLVVLFVEGVDYREVVVRVENSEFLRNFVGFGFAKPMMDFSFVAKAFAAVSKETWTAMNEALGRYGREQEKITGEKLRTDTTAVETNIHYPTDSSLLWDCFRVLSRVLQRVQRELPKLKLTHRYHVKKVKKLVQYIARNAKSPSKKTQRRVFEGEVVPSGEKVYSIFEAHTELIVRGKAGKPVEFGHKVLLCQTGEKFISHWRVLSGEEQDKDLVDEVLERHEGLFGKNPDVFAADKGFYESTEELARLEREIETVSICKKGRRTEAEALRESSDAFQAGQRFRAGVEGSISVLKRAFKFRRCLFQGFKHFAAAVGCAVFCHNLVLLAAT